MLHFLQHTLCIDNPQTPDLQGEALVAYLRTKLNRPMRVCGMVKNVGEPGGGPFLLTMPTGTVSLQILESSQIDMADPEKKAMFEKGTHFNPVDLVCALKNYKGEASTCCLRRQANRLYLAQEQGRQGTQGPGTSRFVERCHEQLEHTLC